MRMRDFMTIVESVFRIEDVEIRSEGKWCFWAYWRGNKIGGLLVNMHASWHEPENARSPYKAAVDRHYQHKGVGTLLYNAAEAALREQGLELIPSKALSDEGYAFWMKRDRRKLRKDGRLLDAQYKGKPIRYQDRDWTIKSCGFNNFILAHETGVTTIMPAQKVFDQLGEPDLPDWAKDDLTESAGTPSFGYKQDNPALRSEEGREWLERKQERALENPRDRGIAGAITAHMGILEPMSLPVSLLKRIPGMRGEKRAPGEPQFEWLLAIAEKEGFDPVNHTISVCVNHEGDAYIVEGNTRVAVAEHLGVPYISAEVKWWNGAEMVEGPWSPQAIASCARANVVMETVLIERSQRVASPKGEPFAIVENPNHAQYVEMLRRAPNGALKGLLSKNGKTLLVWPAYHASHMIAYNLRNGITWEEMVKSRLPNGDLDVSNLFSNWIALWIDKDGVDGTRVVNDAPALLRFLGGPYDMGEGDYL